MHDPSSKGTHNICVCFDVGDVGFVSSACSSASCCVGCFVAFVPFAHSSVNFVGDAFACVVSAKRVILGGEYVINEWSFPDPIELSLLLGGILWTVKFCHRNSTIFHGPCTVGCEQAVSVCSALEYRSMWCHSNSVYECDPPVGEWPLGSIFDFSACNEYKIVAVPQLRNSSFICDSVSSEHVYEVCGVVCDGADGEICSFVWAAQLLGRIHEIVVSHDCASLSGSFGPLVSGCGISHLGHDYDSGSNGASSFYEICPDLGQYPSASEHVGPNPLPMCSSVPMLFPEVIDSCSQYACESVPSPLFEIDDFGEGGGGDNCMFSFDDPDPIGGVGSSLDSLSPITLIAHSQNESYRSTVVGGFPTAGVAGIPHSNFNDFVVNDLSEIHLIPPPSVNEPLNCAVHFLGTNCPSICDGTSPPSSVDGCSVSDDDEHPPPPPR